MLCIAAPVSVWETGIAHIGPGLMCSCSLYSQITEAEALEASIMAAMPHDIAERVYDQLEAIGCHCPARCGLVFPIEDLERVSSSKLPPFTCVDPSPCLCWSHRLRL